MHTFTQKTQDLLRLLGQGYSNAEIAHILNLSTHGIKTRIGIAHRKLGTRTRAHLIIWYLGTLVTKDIV